LPSLTPSRPFYGSLQEYLSELKLELDSLPRVRLGRGHPVIPELGKRGLDVNQGPIVVDLDGVVALIGVVSGRRVVYKLLGVSSDIEAYKLLLALEHGGRGAPIYRGFEEFFNSSDVGIEDLAIKFTADTPPYITSSILVACYEGVCNASIHRIMVGKNYLGVRVVPRHLYNLLQRAGGRLPVAVVIGTHPLVLLAAASSPPLGVFEFEAASYLLEELGRRLVLCRTPVYKLPVPCGASYVFEGVLGPERAREGPFIDVLGLADRVRLEPVLGIEYAYVNRRFTPLHHLIVPASCEHMLLMGLPREAAIYSAVSKVAEVAKVRLTLASGMWLHAIVAISSRKVVGQPVNVGLAALAAHPSLKLVIVVDDDIDPDDPLQVEWALATRVRWGRDVIVIRNARGSTLDPSSDDGVTDKIVIDATKPSGDDRAFTPVIRLPGQRATPPCT
jgi:UbiD family decarboxylase